MNPSDLSTCGCAGAAVDWIEVSGRGTVHSYAVDRRHLIPGFEDDYVIVTVELEEAGPGARIVSNLVGIEPDAIELGMRVDVTFEPAAGGTVLPKFQPAGAAR